MNEDEQDLRVRTEMFRSVMTAAHAALRIAVIINGGAAVATLAFAGSLVQHGKSVSSVALALGCFAFGVLFAAAATGVTYITQSKYHEALYSPQVNSYEEVKRRGNPWKWTTVVLYILSCAMFVVGCLFGVRALLNLT